ncbi:MAG TPA: iron-containing alcohol dehydrogenase [Bacteroidales bacterium]|nr:iron-containing alcohol dehydrogenase [Bacteroidales bacterium]HPT03229.1 iron-containing alcohol dehydrogenase [Bacteroidales bacterium]
MENFTAYNPVKLHFGKGVIDTLAATVKPLGKKVLLVYGKGSVKRSGLYHKISAQLETAGATIFEYGGIKSNPTVKDVDKAAAVGRDNEVDYIVAVGGGSVIDSAKIISITIPVSHSAWKFYEYRAKPVKAVPLVAVLTLAATGSEMNPFAVLQNEETGRKDGYGSDLLFPLHSFLDPEVTYTVPRDYTAYGIADLIAHCLESYFGKGDCTLSDRFISAIIADAMEWGPHLMNNLTGYDERAAIMYDATMALNLMTSYGKANGDWGVHDLGHILSLLYDIPHGASLSILFPAWMKQLRDPAGSRISKLGNSLFGTPGVDDTIARFEAFFGTIGSPVRLSQVGIGEDKFEEIIRVMVRNKAQGNHFKLTEEDYRGIFEWAK